MPGLQPPVGSATHGPLSSLAKLLNTLTKLLGSEVIWTNEVKTPLICTVLKISTSLVPSPTSLISTAPEPTTPPRLMALPVVSLPVLVSLAVYDCSYRLQTPIPAAKFPEQLEP